MKTKYDKDVLPTPVLKSDLKRPDIDELAREEYDKTKYTQYGGFIEFELWFTERFGWCIPTLAIKNVSGRARSRGIETRRSYGIALDGGQLVTIGHGPHVLATHTVYVRKGRLEALRPLLDRMLEGEAKAGDCRDRISTRRAQTSLRRSGLQSWF